MHVVCSPTCAIALLDKKKAIEQKKQLGIEKRETKVRMASLAVIAYKWSNKLQTEVQYIARLIDSKLPCIASGELGQMHGGHVWSKGGSYDCRFNLHNIHRQNAKSNKWKNDDHRMWMGIEREYGKGYHDFVVNLKGKPTQKYTNTEYMEFYDKAVEVSAILKRNPNQKSVAERIRLRNWANEKIGLYDLEKCIFKIKQNNNGTK